MAGVSKKRFEEMEAKAKSLAGRLRTKVKESKLMDVPDVLAAGSGGVTSGVLVYYKPVVGADETTGEGGVDTRALTSLALLLAGFGGITKGKLAKYTMLHGAGVGACYLEDVTVTQLAKYEASKV